MAKMRTALVLVLLLSGCSQDVFEGNNEFLPEVVSIEAGIHEYRAAGRFLKNGKPAHAPMKTVMFKRSFEIMKYQVSAENYQKCVDDNACSLAKKPISASKNRPATGVSSIDAASYIKWFNEKTGALWRLPSDEEWSFAAGSRFVDDAIDVEQFPDDPSRLGLLQYEIRKSISAQADSIVREKGHFGENENGLFDLAGNVWEWTSTCYQRAVIDDKGKVLSTGKQNCNLRVAEGRHRAYINAYVQDARGGGCGAGIPPDYLGFRLVRVRS